MYTTLLTSLFLHSDHSSVHYTGKKEQTLSPIKQTAVPTKKMDTAVILFGLPHGSRRLSEPVCNHSYTVSTVRFTYTDHFRPYSHILMRAVSE